MDAQGTMRLMFDTMDAYDRADFDRLAEIYAEDAQWLNANPKGPHCHNREDIFAMFRQRTSSPCSASGWPPGSGSGSTSYAPHRPRSC
jgi:ketosteroid isomerase-like protein